MFVAPLSSESTCGIRIDSNCSCEELRSSNHRLRRTCSETEIRRAFDAAQWGFLRWRAASARAHAHTHLSVTRPETCCCRRRRHALAPPAHSASPFACSAGAFGALRLRCVACRPTRLVLQKTRCFALYSVWMCAGPALAQLE